MGTILSGDRPPSRVTFARSDLASDEGGFAARTPHSLVSELMRRGPSPSLPVRHFATRPSTYATDQVHRGSGTTEKDRNDGGQHRPYAFVPLISKSRDRRMPKRDTRTAGTRRREGSSGRRGRRGRTHDDDFHRDKEDDNQFHPMGRSLNKSESYTGRIAPVSRDGR